MSIRSLGHYTPTRDFHGPSETPGSWAGEHHPPLSQALSALMPRVASSHPKGRAGTGRKPEGSGHGALSNSTHSCRFFSQGWAAHGAATGWATVPVSMPGGAGNHRALSTSAQSRQGIGSAISETAAETSRGRIIQQEVSEEAGTQSLPPLFFLTQNCLLPGTRNQVKKRK